MTSAHDSLERLVRELRDELALSRATLRLEVPGDQPLPMTHEALADGVDSVQGRVVDVAGAPTVALIMRDRAPVIIEDCRAITAAEPLFDNDGFRAMVSEYGGLASFAVLPVFEGDRLVSILSLHHLGEPRQWSSSDIARILEATEVVCHLYPQFAATFDCAPDSGLLLEQEPACTD